MIIASLSIGWRQHQRVTFTFRRIKSIVCELFEQALYASPLFTAPTTSTDEFADQLADIVTAELDKIAPLHHTTRSSHGRKITLFTVLERHSPLTTPYVPPGQRDRHSQTGQATQTKV